MGVSNKNKIVLLAVIIVLVFVGIVFYFNGTDRVFGEYDFKKGGYYILCNGTEGSTERLYSDDIEVLNQFKKEWVFREASTFYACGYDYYVYVCREGKALEVMEINTDCNEIVTEKGVYKFDAKKLDGLKGRLKKAYSKEDKFSSVIAGREYINSISEEKTLIMCPVPQWEEYEGTFSFECEYDETEESYKVRNKRIVDGLDAEIRKAYPGERFMLSESGSSSGGGKKPSIFVRVTCNKKLYDAFKLYKVEFKWQPYKIYLYTFWTVDPK